MEEHEIIKKGKFVTAFYGGRPFLPGDQIVSNWLESQADRLMHPRMKMLKDAMGNESKLEQILAVFNVNQDDEPVVGNWMLHQCSMNAQKLAKTWERFAVSGDLWRDSVRFTPELSGLTNGKKITKPDFVECYQVSITKPDRRSFFRAYQGINPGAEFTFTIHYPDDLCTKVEGTKKADKKIVPDPDKTKECVNAVLAKMCLAGLGAYRQRFGKFQYID